MNKLKVMSIFGTRPEAIKMAPVIFELRKHSEFIESSVVVTAQHREMLDQVLKLFDIHPDFDLNIMSKDQTLFDITRQILSGIDEILSIAKPEIILVHGDTITTFVASLAAYFCKVKIGHVEAGLRTQNKFSPFPEEMNRRLTDVLADLYFAPTKVSKENLLREGVDEKKIFLTGNTIIDALHKVVRKKFEFQKELTTIDYENRKVVLLTTHRRENLGEPLHQILEAVRDLVRDFENFEVIFPVHRNPKVRDVVNEILYGIDRIHIIEPLDYENFANLMNQVSFILTDSGGVQEEASSLGKPVLVLRDTTERIEAIEAGAVKLIGTNREKVYEAVKSLLINEKIYKEMLVVCSPYGDGHAAERIVKILLRQNNFLKEYPGEFKWEFSKST